MPKLMPKRRYRRGRRNIRYDHALAALRIAAIAVLVLVLLPYLLVPFYWLINPVSTLMVWRWVTGQRVERVVVPLAQMGPYLPVTVMVAEDGRFCSHYGVDFQEMHHLLNTAEQGEEVRGGSTITQQVVKNLFLWPQRSYLRKALEIPLALWTDLILSKRRIMDIYLNIAEWGPNGEFGAQAAARRDFGRPAATLTPYQAALMAASLPNPHLRDPRRPDPALVRLAELYRTRAARAAGTECVQVSQR